MQAAFDSARSWSSAAVMAALLFVTTVAPTATAQTCTPVWSDEFNIGGVDLIVHSATVFDDDGEGPNPPALYVGGEFKTAGDVVAANIAKWDGESWYALGSGLGGYFPLVKALAVFDDDGEGPNPPALYAGGDFTTAGGVPVSCIAKWDGKSWSALPGGFSGYEPRVHSLLVVDEDGSGPNPPVLVVGGNFTGVNGVPANGIVKWDGSSWSPIAGLLGDVHALAMFDDDGAGPNPPALCAGGVLAGAGDVQIAGIAKWNGKEWEALGAGIPYGGVYALAAYDDDGAGPNQPALYVGGGFDTAGGIPAERIAKWDGSAWSAVGSGMWHSVETDVTELVVYDDDGDGPNLPVLIAGGLFESPADSIAKWNGSHWSPLGSGMSGAPGRRVRALTVVDHDQGGPEPPVLIAGGWFSVAGDAPAESVAQWDGTSWSRVGLDSHGLTEDVFAMANYDRDGTGSLPPRLVVGGRFIVAGETIVNGVAEWDGEAWSALGTGLYGEYAAVRAVATVDPDGAGPEPPLLCVGGNFDIIGGVAAEHVAAWDGSTWAPMGDGLDNTVRALLAGSVASAPSRLFAASSYAYAWDGNEWSRVLGSPGNIYALAIYDEDDDGPIDPALYVGITSTSSGARIMKWDGESWYPLGDGVSGGPYPRVKALAVFDDDGSGPSNSYLYVGGNFTDAGGVSVENIARWNGTSWNQIGDGIPACYEVRALTVFDEDGDGPVAPALYAAFDRSSSGANIARWDGETWTLCDSGTDLPINALAVFDRDEDGPCPPGLYAGGMFALAGDLPSGRVARWGCPLYALGDLNCDCGVNSGDINPFVLALTSPASYAATYPQCDIMKADINEDGHVDFGDINPFVDLLAGGW